MKYYKETISSSTSNINDWTDEEKCLYLAVFLRDRHKECWGTYLQMQEKILEEMFSPCNQTDLHRTQLRERRQKAHESLLELGQDDVINETGNQAMDH
jgi:hypothetical protein